MALLMTMPRDNGEADVLIILGDDSISRIKEHDPLGFPWEAVPVLQDLKPGKIGVVWADDTDMGIIVGLMREGRNREAFEHATRGESVRPGDLRRPVSLTGPRGLS